MWHYLCLRAPADRHVFPYWLMTIQWVGLSVSGMGCYLKAIVKRVRKSHNGQFDHITYWIDSFMGSVILNGKFVLTDH